MKKIILILSAALMLTGCNGLFKPEASAMAADSDSIVLNDDEFIEEVEGGEPVSWALSAYEKELMNIDDLPESAVLQERLGSLLLYVNVEAAPDEDNPEGTYSVWVASEERVIVAKVLTTNPTAAASWDKMTGKDASGVEVPMNLIAAASSAKFASEDGCKIIVEGCPDSRNIWTYLIDLEKRTAIQLPSTEGVQDIDMEQGEIIAASYGYYDEGGRYTVNKAYSLDGKFIRQTSDPEPE